MIRKHTFRVLLFLPSPNESGRSMVPHGRVKESLKARRFPPNYGFKSFMCSLNHMKNLRYIELHKLMSSMRIPDTELMAITDEHRTPIYTDSTDLSFRKPFLSRNDSSIDIPSSGPHHHSWSGHDDKPSGSPRKPSFSSFVLSFFRNIRSGHRYMKRLFFMISLNVPYSTVELLIGLFTGRVGLVSDAVHSTFGCGLLTFSLFVMGVSRKKPDGVYTYGYKRLEVLSAFTNAFVS
ncbi:metal tolerance protein C2-like [Vicia villosa]|uniref:metal tolerance protein C2-like n=1 Tax=Vicia villosa TaxID=3911 RepID=UPI00273B2119|nr:metal tolerance protein C2-like [Vicia villosa]